MFPAYFCVSCVVVIFVGLVSSQECPCSAFSFAEEKCKQYVDFAQCDVQSEKIINALIADLAEWKYMVSLQFKDDSKGLGCYVHECAAMMIAPQVAITAAHCVYRYLSRDAKKAGFGVLQKDIYASHLPRCRHLGSSRVSGRAIVDMVYFNMGYDSFTANADIALLHIDKQFPPPYVKLQTQPQQVQVVQIAGWGEIDLNEWLSQEYNLRQLYEQELDYLDAAMCKLFIAEFNGDYEEASRLDPNTMFCAHLSSSDTCAGDSGGPAVIKGIRPEDDILVGITSWGPRNQCNESNSEQAPAVFTRIDAYADWIAQTLTTIQSTNFTSTSNN